MDMLLTYVKVFAVGGILCAAAQILIDKTSLTPARILVGYVVAGVVLTAIGVYEPIVKFASCGATVPLTGFGYSLAKGVEKAINERGAIGILCGGIQGTATGIAASVVFGYIFSRIFRSGMKRS